MNKKNILKITLTCIFVLILGGTFYFEFPAIQNVYSSVISSFTPKPETFTELYFENHLTLPTNFNSKKAQSFAFTIHNLENRDMHYIYEVYIQTPGLPKRTLATGNVFVKNSQAKKITQTLLPTYIKTRSAVVVNLINKNEKIDFWMEGTK